MPQKTLVRRIALALVITATVAAALFALMRLTGLERTWPLRTLVAYTPYLTLLALVPPIAAAVLRKWRLALAGLIAPLVLASLVVPRAFPDSQPEATGPRLTVMTLNLWIGQADAGKVVEMVGERGVDVLSVQELSVEAVARLDAAGIGALLPYREVRVTPGVESEGTGVYSRYPLARNTVLEFPATFAMTGVTITVPGTAPVELLAAHPAAPWAATELRRWLKDLESLPSASGGSTRIIAGDFNATLDHAALREVLDRGFNDAADEVGMALRGTWKGRSGLLALAPRVALDHVFVDERVAVESVDFGDPPGTDHLPVFAVLRLPGQ
ncbi:endonuclease [Actinorhabdospora filicis]|uniref:Endonuclease n=1 Tax=Actinorhabdospora filicis TaxID=1785913 RepID=A0A9W6SJD0_9ACTN|nr:endonuclease/exonuclease/phosphatase family protein [Actinorhabdospora filicis]GLZ76877.1 endonuclease [Actinorhabdospora filicis]